MTHRLHLQSIYGFANYDNRPTKRVVVVGVAIGDFQLPVPSKIIWIIKSEFADLENMRQR